MTTQDEIKDETPKLLNDALAECEVTGDWSDPSSVIHMGDVDTERLTSEVIESLEINVKSSKMYDAIARTVTEAAETWKSENAERLAALKE